MKQAVIEEKYATKVQDMLKEHLQKQNVSAAEMAHLTPRTIWEERALLSNVNVGDWVDVAYDYMPGTCSKGTR